MADKSIDVCIVGSANLDLVTAVDHLVRPGETILATAYQEHPGGKGLNQAVACARMGAVTAFVGCVGTDGAGDVLMRVMERESINTAGVSRIDEPAGRAFISVERSGENNIIVVPGSNSQIKPDQGADQIAASRVVLAQLEIPLDVVIRAFEIARASGGITVLNPAPIRDLPDVLLALTDYVVPNEVEADHIGGVARCLGLGAKAVVTTLGAAGVRIVTPAGETHIGAVKVVPVDTTAAGDAFLGGFCSSLANGESLEDAVSMGATTGALAVTKSGAVPSLPTRNDVIALKSQ